MRFYGVLYTITYAILLITIFVLPFFSFKDYSIIRNSISELGAQNVPNNWIMNSSIMLMSLSIIALGFKSLKTNILQIVFLLIFSFSFLLTGIFEMAGLDYKVYRYNYTYDALHSLFSLLTGIAFCVFCILLIFILKEVKHKIQSITMCTLAMVLTFLIFIYPEYRGLFQRLLFVSAFSWLFFALVSYKKKKNVSYFIHKYKYYEKKL